MDNGVSFDPVLQLRTNRELIIDRFKLCMKIQYPNGVVSGAQYYDIIREWCFAWHECLFHLNQVHGMKQPVNDEIVFFQRNFSEILGPNWVPTAEWRWWN